MIFKEKVDRESLFPIDVGRPNLFDDRDFAFWQLIHNYVKTCDFDVVVGGAFMFVDDYLRDRGGYGGGDMKYKFLFFTYEDREKFKEYFIQSSAVIYNVNLTEDYFCYD